MTSAPNYRYKLLSKFSILIILSVFLWNFSRGAAPAQSSKTKTMEVVTRQLAEHEGRIPVELVCGYATLSAPNIVQGFTCKLRNSSNRGISAASVIYTIQFEEDGSSKATSYDSTIDTRLYSDFSDTTKVVGPGEESTSVGPPGQVSLISSATVTGIEIAIDFVEFEDSGVLGPDREGSNIINGMRGGAKKYRTWLRHEYERNSLSVDAVLPSLDDDGNIPSGVQTTSSYEELGARAYRSRLKRAHRTKGKAEVEKILSSGI
jgi:hypothetical protein